MDQYALEHRLTNFEPHVRNKKKVIEGINQFDKMGEMDMIIIGTHGRKGFSQLIKANVAESLINHLHKPVLVYKI